MAAQKRGTPFDRKVETVAESVRLAKRVAQDEARRTAAGSSSMTSSGARSTRRP